LKGEPDVGHLLFHRGSRGEQRVDYVMRNTHWVWIWRVELELTSVQNSMY